MSRTGRPLKHTTPLKRVLVRLDPETLETIDKIPGVRNDKINFLLRDALDQRRRAGAL